VTISRHPSRALTLLLALGTAGGCLSACTGSAKPGHSPAPAPSSAAASTLPSQNLASAGDPFAPGDGNGGYDVQHYGLKLAIDPSNLAKELDGTAEISAKATSDLTRFDLDLSRLTVASVTVDGTAARFDRQGSELVITPARPIAKGSAFTTLVAYSGTPQTIVDPTLGRYGWIQTTNGVFVADQPSGAHTWFPGNDHPSDKATFDFEITVPSGLNVIANGEPVGRLPSAAPTETPLTPSAPSAPSASETPETPGSGSPSIATARYRADTTTYRWHESDPMATYLATVDVGHFQIKRGKTPGGIPITTAVEEGTASTTVTQLYATVAQITDAWTKLFGPYPFTSTGAIVGNASVNFALETQDRPIFGAFGANDPTIVAHELAHQWYGDSVTLTKWQDIWLNEGFATYAEWTWGERLGGRTVQQQFDDHYRLAGARWSIPTADPGSRANMFDDFAVYARGAMALHALRQRVGDDTFWKILRTWAADHRHGYGTTAEFVATAQRVAGKDLSALFQAWLYGKTRPTSW
jgi:aminopeptidase N